MERRLGPSFALFLIGMILLLLSLVLNKFLEFAFLFYALKIFAIFVVLSSFYVYFFMRGNPFKKSVNYIKESKEFIYLNILIFFVFALIGFLVPVPSSVVDFILSFIKELLESMKGLSQLGLVKFILLNNLQSSFMGMMFGAILSVFPFISTIVNGYLMGFVVSLSVRTEGILVLWKLFPHGIFELPAVFISLGLGLKFGTFFFQKNRWLVFKKYLLNSLRVFLFIVLPLLIIAAIIEGSLIFLFS